MTVGVVGLGLIGGSFVKAYHAAGHRVLTWNRNPSMLEYTMLSGEADGKLDESSAKDCDLILLCVYPEAAIAWLREMAPQIGPHPMVIDCCGTKQVVCEACFPWQSNTALPIWAVTPWRGLIFPDTPTRRRICIMERLWYWCRPPLTTSSC